MKRDRGVKGSGREILTYGAEAVIYWDQFSDGTDCCVKEIERIPNIHISSLKGGEQVQERAYKKKREHLSNEWSVWNEIYEENAPLVKFYDFQVSNLMGIETKCDLIMEYIPGDDLGDRKYVNSLDFSDKIDFLLQTARAIDYIHERGYLHFDIKPHNTMVTERQVKLIDLGTALPKGDAIYEGKGGTPLFRPYEQYIGSLRKDERTDIFSFGATIDWMFGGNGVSESLREFFQDTAKKKKDLSNEEDPAVEIRRGKIPDKDLEEMVVNFTRIGINRRPKSFKPLIGELERIYNKHS